MEQQRNLDLMNVSEMDAGELREYLADKFAWGYLGTRGREVERAVGRLAKLLKTTTAAIREQARFDADLMRDA